MTHVWLAVENFPYEGYVVRGVAATKEAAQRICEEHAEGEGLGQWEDLDPDTAEACARYSEYEVRKLAVVSG